MKQENLVIYIANLMEILVFFMIIIIIKKVAITSLLMSIFILFIYLFYMSAHKFYPNFRTLELKVLNLHIISIKSNRIRSTIRLRHYLVKFLIYGTLIIIGYYIAAFLLFILSVCYAESIGKGLLVEDILSQSRIGGYDSETKI